MAKLHSRGRGKSKSRKKKTREIKKVDVAKIKELIVDLSKKGTRPSEIGRLLRDEHGVPDVEVLLKKRLVTFLKEENVAAEYPQDLLDLIKKAVGMREHMKKNKSDRHNKVKLAHVESKISRLVKYYKKSGTIPATWKYQPESAALLVK